jgi:hypothetical protein
MAKQAERGNILTRLTDTQIVWSVVVFLIVDPPWNAALVASGFAVQWAYEAIKARRARHRQQPANSP